jgi:hypothetical protein
MADGSIRTVSYSADSKVLKAVASIAGREVATLEN